MKSKLNEKDIIDLYVNKLQSSIKISKIYNCTKKTILDCLKRNNIKRRDRLNCKIGSGYNREYFKEINTEEKAYFLGLLYADGCNTGKGFSISLQSNDKYLIDKLQIALEAQKIKIIKRNRAKPHHKDQFSLSITSKNMSNDLIKLGCIPRKSLILKFPNKNQVSNNLLHHFIRGYFDGDGCICLTKKNTKRGISIEGRVNITSSVSFCDKLNKIFKKLKIRFNSLKRFPDIECDTLHSGGTFNLIKFYNFIYKDASIFMSRKKILFEELFKIKKFKLDGTKEGKGNNKYRGVYIRDYIIKGKKYTYIRAMIILNKKRIVLGTFKTELEAAKVYDKKCLELYKDKAILNFPVEGREDLIYPTIS